MFIKESYFEGILCFDSSEQYLKIKKTVKFIFLNIKNYFFQIIIHNCLIIYLSGVQDTTNKNADSLRISYVNRSQNNVTIILENMYNLIESTNELKIMFAVINH
jgi:hypothetical protein